MIDRFDYEEPICPLCSGEKFYSNDENTPSGTVPMDRVIAKLDNLLETNQTAKAEELLDYWLKEGEILKDKKGVLAILSEQMGHYRKTGNAEKGLEAVRKGLELVEELNMKTTLSGATVMLNAATTMKAFGNAEQGLPIYGEVYAVYQKELCEFDSKKSGLYNNMALALVDVKKYSEAETFYKMALEVLFNNKGYENEIAITYVNLAHLYEETKETEKINEQLTLAIKYLNSPNIIRNGYHAYVCSKIAPSFKHFGYDIIESMLNKRVEEIYARN